MQGITTQTHVSQNTPLIFHCLETIIDKKVGGIALSFFERIADWFCSWFYPAYLALYNERRIAQQPPQPSQAFPTPTNHVMWDQTLPLSGPMPLACSQVPRVYCFPEGIPLFDHTTRGIAGITRVQYVDLIQAYKNRNTPGVHRQGQTIEYITLNAKRVLLTARTDTDLIFSRHGHTDYVIVKDSTTRGPGWFDIIEHETLRPGATAPRTNVFEVDTNKVFRLTLQAGLLEIGNAIEVYLLESEVEHVIADSGLEQIVSES